MFYYNKCLCAECNKTALSSFDEKGEISNLPGYCFEHTSDKEGVFANIRKYLQTHDTIVGLCASGLMFDSVNLSGKRFYGCELQHCSFTNVHAEDLRAKMCIMDFTTFTDCNFINNNLLFNSFSGAKFVHVIFTGSELVHNNYNGITSYQSSFDNTNLYNSRFIKAILLNTSMKNCNLKKTIFYNSVRENVSFKLSNTREALVDRNRSGLIEDFTELSEGDSVL